MARIKQLLLLGERTDAVTLYVAEAHCDRATSEATIDAYAADDVWSTMRKGRLDAMGMAMFFGALFLLTGSVALGVTNRVSWVVAAVIAALPSLWVLLASPNALQALRYLRATAGEATVVRFAFIGKNTQSDSLFRLLVDVREPSGKTFRAEMLTVLGEAHALAMREGHRMRVKYFPGAAASLAYDGEVP